MKLGPLTINDTTPSGATKMKNLKKDNGGCYVLIIFWVCCEKVKSEK